tara:strand:- start:243 stop:509 length:267 start_codon:yes stop_codon:yes gene_type:complete
MKWYLVDKYDNINTSAELHSSYGKVSAKAYFLGMKQLEEEEFDKLWKVMTQTEYDWHFKNSLQNRQLENRKYEWWKDEPSGPDDEFDY